MRLALAFSLPLLATFCACEPYSFVAPTPSPDYVAGAISPHSVWVVRTAPPSETTCATGAAGICVRGVRVVLEQGLQEVMHRVAAPPTTQSAADFIAEIGPVVLTDAYERTGYHLQLQWVFTMRDRAGTPVILLHDTESMVVPVQSAPPGPEVEGLMLRLENAALNRIDDVLARSAMMH